MSAIDEIDLLKVITDVCRKIDILAFDAERYNPPLSDHLRDLYRELDEATDKFVWGRPLRTYATALVSVPDRPLDELGER